MPRPTKLDATNKQRLIWLISQGATLSNAALAVGCCRRTVERAARRDEPFAWRLNLARDARDAQAQLDESDEPRAAVAGTDDHDQSGPVFDSLSSELAHEPHRLWQAGRPGCFGACCNASGCDKTATPSSQTN